MKKVLLLLRHTKEQFNNDTKYQGIFKAFVNLGYEVFRTYIDQNGIWVTNEKNSELIGKILFRNEKFFRNTSMYIAVSKFIAKNNFDYCYIRFIPTTKMYTKMISEIKQTKCRIMIEIPTYPTKGELDSDKWYRKVIRKKLEKNEKRSIKNIDLYLLLGEKANNYLGCPAINIENGVDVELFNPKHYKKTKDLHIVFVGKVARWHGLDRVIEGIKDYYKQEVSKKIYFHIIGSDADGTLKMCQKLTKRYELEDYVLFEGPKYGAESDKYFDIAEVAIASLGDHRRGVNNISLLKIKEYMARGIPFVYSMNDNMIDSSWEFCLKIPSDDSPVDINQLINFVETIEWDNTTMKMRSICRKSMGWEAQLSKALHYFGD